jgi:biopolymer transport protein ExbD
MAMSSSGGGSDEPMMDINTTPLIDVMLVLLIMFIITLPPPTHSVKIDLPPDCKTLPAGCPPKPPVDPVRNRIYIGPDDTVTWNGSPLTLLQLRTNLEEMKAIPDTKENPGPELILQPDPEARHERVSLVLRETKYAKITKFGFEGNEAYYYF